MANINLNKVSISFPIYNVNARSFKKSFIRLATGGKVAEQSKHVVVNALQQISLSLTDGDRLGLIGHNGSGKSTLLRLIAQIYEPTSGTVEIEGRIFPMLDIMHGIEAEFTGVENILSRGTILGLNRSKIRQRIAEIAEFSGLGDYIHMPIRTYSSGMMVRLAFAISTTTHPEILLIDEIFGAGDANFMEKARQRMINLLEQSSIVVLTTHSNELIKEFCNKVLLLEGGQVKYFGNVEDGLKLYQQR